MEILFIGEDISIKEKIASVIEKHFSDFVLISANTRQQAILHIRNYGAPVFVVLDSEISFDSLPDLFVQLAQLTSRQPVIMIGPTDGKKIVMPEDFQSVNPSNVVIHRKCEEAHVKKAVESVTSIENDVARMSPFEIADSETMPIKIRNFYRYNVAPYDTLLKVSTNKYLKVFHKDEEIQTTILKKFLAKNVRYLYLQKKDHLQFITNSTNVILQVFKSNKVSLEHHFVAQINACALIQEQIRTLGVTDTVKEFTKQVVRSFDKQIKQYDKLMDLVSDFPLKEKDVTEQSVLIGYICEYLLQKTGTLSDISKLKLGISALLHDCFIENDRLAIIHSKISEEYTRLNQKDKELFDQHVQLATDMAKDFNAHAELDFIINEHHELPNGTGFPRGLNAHSINQLSAIFILSRNFVSGICRTGTSKKSVGEILRKLTNDFEKGNFRVPLKALVELLSEA